MFYQAGGNVRTPGSQTNMGLEGPKGPEPPLEGLPYRRKRGIRVQVVEGKVEYSRAAVTEGEQGTSETSLH